MSTPAAGKSAPQTDQDIGAGLRSLRRARKLSLIDMAARTNLSIGFLSQIERGKSSPTLRALVKAEQPQRQRNVVLFALPVAYPDMRRNKGIDQNSDM